MRIRYVDYPTGDNCPVCGGPVGYRAKFAMVGSWQDEIGRDGPACLNDDCANRGTPVQVAN